MPNPRRAARQIANECYGVRVRALSRVVSRIYDEELRHLGIKMSQLNVLVFATLRPGSRAADVGERLHIEKSTVSRNLARMESRGWIKTSDGITVTRAGEQLFEQAVPAWRRAQKRVRAELGVAAAESLVSAADELLG